MSKKTDAAEQLLNAKVDTTKIFAEARTQVNKRNREDAESNARSIIDRMDSVVNDKVTKLRKARQTAAYVKETVNAVAEAQERIMNGDFSKIDEDLPLFYHYSEDIEWAKNHLVG